jgi:hypothetical protein
MPGGSDDPRRLRLRAEGCCISSGEKGGASMLLSTETSDLVDSTVDAEDVSVVKDVGVVERMELMISDWLCRSAVVCCKVSA